ncbi:MAG TPA: outer membrane beta-barrel protein [Candidatus Acidoferrum sp.]|nr:outer membrane beta-barrel protein [Candidatus Acidoferrum sp.]
MKTIAFSSLALFLCAPAFAQQSISINRYTVYTGFDYFNNPGLSLSQRGFDVDFGVTLKPWIALGADFSASGDSIISGGGTINGSSTVYAPILIKAAPLGAPPPSSVNVPFKATSYTFAAGPQFYWRKWRQVTFLGRPGLGGIHAAADVTLPPQLVGLLQLLGAPVPSAHQTDTRLFFGLGGGFDLNVSKRVGLRVTTDWINTHLFPNLLTNRQNFVRVTIGPTFRWGRLE